jgi:hypothetical protein
MNAIEHYIGELSSHLRVSRRTRNRILAEVRDHLDDGTARLVRAGDDTDRAVARVIESFGPASAIATEFNAEAGTRAMRRAPIVAFGTGVGVFAGLLVAARAQPHPAVPMRATLITQVAFFVAVLAFQVAVVAGMCAASRTVAIHRAPVAPSHDRQYVRLAANISTGAAAIAAAGWTITLAIAVHRLTRPNTAAAMIGGAIVVAAASVGIAATRRLRVNASDSPAGADAEPAGVFNIGERCIALVTLHPVESCTAVAALSIWPAMAHAETTFTAALPWGIAQAAAVIIAFMVLGPVLELRHPHAA